MLRARLSGAVLLGLVLLGIGHGEETHSTGFLEPTPDPWVAPDRPPRAGTGDTLRPSVEAGEPLLLTLPAQLEATPVDHYTLLRGPALSGVAGHSFTWIPQSVEPGTHDVLLRAVRPEAPPDTLVLRVEVQE